MTTRPGPAAGSGRSLTTLTLGATGAPLPMTEANVTVTHSVVPMPGASCSRWFAAAPYPRPKNWRSAGTNFSWASSWRKTRKVSAKNASK